MKNQSLDDARTSLTWLPFACVAAIVAGCGAKTDLDIGQVERPGRDASITFDAMPMDAAVDADMTFDMGTDMFTDPDMWVPECPDSIRVTTREASVPVDIIFVIDNSGSMLDDIDNMRANMEIFWDGLSSADIDAHVIFVTQEGFAPTPPPAFSGRFYPVGERVNSHDGLNKLLSQFHTYRSFLRPDAITHFVGITDDDANFGEGEIFLETMTDLLGHDFTFHSIASERIMPSPANPSGACVHSSGFAYSPGYEWYFLSDATGGIKLSICEEDWSALLPPLTERIAIRIPIPCGYRLPTPPPAGITYREEDFTVLFEEDAGGLRVIPRDGTGTCASGGWNYAEGSRRIELCETTCDELMALDGRVDIDLGCSMIR